MAQFEGAEDFGKKSKYFGVFVISVRRGGLKIDYVVGFGMYGSIEIPPLWGIGRLVS